MLKRASQFSTGLKEPSPSLEIACERLREIRREREKAREREREREREMEREIRERDRERERVGGGGGGESFRGLKERHTIIL